MFGICGGNCLCVPSAIKGPWRGNAWPGGLRPSGAGVLPIFEDDGGTHPGCAVTIHPD